MCNTLRGTAFVLLLVLAGFSAVHHVDDANPILHSVIAADTTYEVEEVEWAGQTYIGRRDTVSFDAIGGFFEQHLEPLYTQLQQNGVESTGHATGLYWDWNEELMTATMAAAVPVPEGTTAPEGYEIIEVPAGSAYAVDYYGAYDDMMSAHEAISAHIEEKNLNEVHVAIEEYFTDPEMEPDTSKWHTRITYVLEGAM